MARNSFPIPIILIGFAFGGFLLYLALDIYKNPISNGKTVQNNTESLGIGKPISGSNNPSAKDPLDPANKPTREMIYSIIPNDPLKSYQNWIKKYYDKFQIIGSFPKNEYYVNASEKPGQTNWVKATFWGSLHGFPYPTRWWKAETNEGTELRQNHLNDKFSRQLSLQDIHESSNGKVVWTKGTFFYVTPSKGFSDNPDENRILAFS